MSELVLKNVCKTYGNNVDAVRDFTLDIHDHEFVVFVGPSGCGKSTTLQLIAGLEDVTSGEIWIDGELVNDLEPKDRNIAMVFQNYSLYPYMSVFDNMAFGLKMRKVPKAEIREKVEKVAATLELSDVLKRKPRELSGGQRQRVAMGRAMVRDPKVFLMDEPLSNLDMKLRNTLRREIANLHNDLDATFVYVTHDQTEAMTLGDRIVVMDKGKIMQVGTPQKIHDEPANIFVAGFIGTPQMNFFPARCEIVSGRIRLNIGGRYIDIPGGKQARIAEAGFQDREVTLGIRPEAIYDTPEMAARYPGDVLDFTVRNYEMTGSDVYLYFMIDGQEVCARADTGTVSRADSTVSFTFNPDKLHIFDPETGDTVTN